MREREEGGRQGRDKGRGGIRGGELGGCSMRMEGGGTARGCVEYISDTR